MPPTKTPQRTKVLVSTVEPPDEHHLSTDKSISGAISIRVHGPTSGTNIEPEFSYKDQNSVHSAIASSYRKLAQWAREVAEEADRQAKIYDGN